MSFQTTVQDLPDEMLEQVLLQLPLEDCKSARSVCKRWAQLKPFNLSSVQLTIHTDRFNEEDYRALLASSLRYKHVVVNVDFRFRKYDLLLKILSSISRILESLQLNWKLHFGKPPIGLNVFANITTMSNLKQLRIDGGVFQTDQAGLNFARMDNLEELHLLNNKLLNLIPNMQDVTPNIKKLHISIDSEESLHFLRHFSSQLLEMEVWLTSEYDLLAVCTMLTPLLEKLTIRYFGGTPPHVGESHEVINQFFGQLSGLKALSFQNILIDYVSHLCRLESCKNIRFLHLDIDLFIFLDAHAICGLKHLERLYIDGATLDVPDEFDFEPLRNLRMLTLTYVELRDVHQFYRFCQYTFPNLTVFELLEVNSWEPDLLKLYENICNNLPSLERLTVRENTGILKLDLFLKFCATIRVRELRVGYEQIMSFYSREQLCPISVEVLIMRVQNISFSSLRKLIKSMEKLRRLELAFCNLSRKEMTGLRNAFPQCEIIFKQRVQIEEPL